MLKFIFETLDPICWEIYNESFIQYADDWDEVTISEGYLYSITQMSKFKIHPNTLKIIEPKSS